MPTHSLYDPMRNRYFRFSWPQFEMLRRWRLGEPEKIAEAVNQSTTLNVAPENVIEVAMFLQGNNLVQVRGPGLELLAAQAKMARRHWAEWLLHNYLFLRVPLFRPDEFLSRTGKYFEFVYSRRYVVFMACALVLGLYLVNRQWDEFVHTFNYFFSFQGLIYYGLTLIVAKCFHELGHAYTARHFGVRVPTIGVGLLVLMPVMYTDTSDAWKLTDNRKRMLINAAGFLAELSLAILALLAWSFLPDGALRSVAFLVATTTSAMSLLINFNPFMRWDGYYLLSDWLEVDNLQPRAFALARWKLREVLFGFGDPPPEEMDAGLRLQLMAYAWATWLYRFFLFLAISVLVYFFFFKLLGIFLMAVEIGWFIVLPIAMEIGEWWKNRKRIRSVSGYRTLAFLVLIILLLLIPWQTRVALPAMLDAQHRVGLYAPEDAEILRFPVHDGQRVASGDVLVELKSDKLEHDLKTLKHHLDLLKWQASAQGVSGDVAAEGRILRQQLSGEIAEYHAMRQRIKRLRVTAPFSGKVVMVNLDAKRGDYVQRGEKLLSLVDTARPLVRAYVSESNLNRFSAGAAARFYPDDPSISPLDMRVEDVDKASAKVLLDPPLASVYGGGVPVIQNKNGQLIPQQAVYRVLLRPLRDSPVIRSLRGKVYVEGARKSPLARFANRVMAVIIRESGF